MGMGDWYGEAHGLAGAWWWGRLAQTSRARWTFPAVAWEGLCRRSVLFPVGTVCRAGAVPGPASECYILVLVNRADLGEKLTAP